MRGDRRKADLCLRSFFSVLAEFDGDGMERGPDGFFEGLVFLASRQCMATRERDDNQGFGNIGEFLVVAVFRQGDSSVDQILMALLEFPHAGFDFSLPSRGHLDMAAFDF
jgi:hypothetical protein